MDKTKYYVLNKKAVPEVLLKVVEVKHLLATRKGMTIGEAAEEYKANILTIHQSIPLNGVATLTLSVEVLSTTGNLSEMVAKIEEKEGVHYLKIVGRE